MTYPAGGPFNRSEEHSLKCEIAAEALRSFGSLRLRVTGHSMLPAIWPGDTLMINHCEISQIVPGNVVLCSRQNRLWAHRFVRIISDVGSPQLITQGDSLPNPDPPISPSELLGRVSEIIRRGQCIRPLAIPAGAARHVANLLRHCSFLSRLLVHLHTERASPLEREDPCHT